MIEKSLPHHCPSCSTTMVIVKLQCPSCKTEVSGEFELCPVCTLDDKLRDLFDLFLKARGNLKDVQRKLKVSYPTARQRVEKMFQALEEKKSSPSASDVLSKLRNGEITVDQAEELLRKN